MKNPNITATKDELNTLADKFEKAGFGSVGIGEEDFAQLGLKLQKSFKSLKGYRLQIQGNWEGLCSYVHEKLTGKEHPGSQCRGRGFRSQAYAKTVAEVIRKVAEER